MKQVTVTWQEFTTKRHTFDVPDDFDTDNEDAIWDLVADVAANSTDLNDEILSVVTES